MRTIKVKAVILTDGEHYVIHGSDAETSIEMFKAVAPIWPFDPATETAHYVELDVDLPEFDGIADVAAFAG